MNLFARTIVNPGMFHGHRKQPPFFEGWYYKLVSADEQHRFAIIPGVILGESQHSFIQVLDGVTGSSAYHSFPIDAFWASERKFEIRVGDSRFNAERIDLNISDELGLVSGSLQFEGGVGWPVRWWSPGIMGWYAWVPRMECYHGVLSFDHTIHGTLNINQKGIDFSAGRGYIEKDWGQSFPSAWVWAQTNHFERPGTCLTASIAMIPWMGSAFRGFIIGLWHQGKLFRFATYTGAKVERLEIGAHTVHWVVSDSKYRLEMEICQAPGGVLLGPTTIEMGKRVEETLDATVSLRLTEKSGQLLFEGLGKYAGLEVNGDLPRLTAA